MKRERIRHKKHHLSRDCYLGEVCIALTACIEAGRPIFRNSAIVAAFTDILRDAAERNDCVVPVYCFMPEHLHAAIKGQSESPTHGWLSVVSNKEPAIGYPKILLIVGNQTSTITSSAAINHLQIRSDISSTIPCGVD